MQTMISTGLARYAGRELKVGQKFEVEDQHVRTLELTRKAKKGKPKPDANETETKDMTAGSNPGYSTRDMAAGDQAPPQVTRGETKKR